MKRSLAMAAAALIVAAALTTMTPRPALANQTSCYYSSFGSCWTGQLNANPRYHAVYMQARAFAGPHRTRCYLFDNRTWVLVGEVTSYKRTESTIVRGLYGTYQANCVRSGAGSGHGDGMIANDDYFVD